MCAVTCKESTSSTTDANSVPLSVLTTAGGPNMLMTRSRRKLATVLAVLLGRGASITNLEKTSTAIAICRKMLVAEAGNSTIRSKAQVWRGPGGSATSDFHFGYWTDVSQSWQEKHVRTC